MQEKNYEVIDQMYSALLSQNESQELIDALRPQVEEASVAGIPKPLPTPLPTPLRPSPFAAT